MIKKINLADKFERINEYWSPRIAGELNDAYLKLARLSGEFLWHYHEHEDELFLVIKGQLTIKLREQEIHLDPGELVIIPRGLEHMPVAETEVHVLLLEPKTTRHTGNVLSERSRPDRWID